MSAQLQPEDAGPSDPGAEAEGQFLPRLHRGSRLLSGSSPSSPRPLWRPWPSAGCRKFCLVTRCFPFPPPSMEKASGVSVASSSSEDGAGGGGGLAVGSGGVEQGGLEASPLGGDDGAQSVGEVSGGLKEEGGRGSAAGQAYTSASRSLATTAACSSAGSVALGGRMLSLAMVAWMELMGMSPPRTMSCWDSWREYGCTGKSTVRRGVRGD